MFYMFGNCPAMMEPPSVGNWNTSAVTNMGSVFSRCSSMTVPPTVGSWNTSNVTDMSWMFSDCSAMTEQPAVNNWNTSAVTNMDSMFNGCSKMPLLDINKWNFLKVTSKSNYLGLQDCPALKELKVPAGAKIAGLSEHAAQGEYVATWGNEEREIIGLTAASMIATINAGNGAGTWK